MDIREADTADVGRIAEMRQRLPPGFPSAEALINLRARLDMLMPVARVETGIVGFALAALLITEEGRLGGRVRYLLALVDDGPAAWAIKTALLARLELQFRALDADEIQVGADHSPALTDQLQKIGYRLDDSVRARSPRSGPQFVKRLSAGVPAQARAAVRGRRA